MILYFSATGNCKYVAARLAEADGQEVLSIADCMRVKRFSFEDETIGVISPTYDWGGRRASSRSFWSRRRSGQAICILLRLTAQRPARSARWQRKRSRAAASTPIILSGCRIPGRRSLTFPRRKRSQSTQSTRNRRSIAWFRACANAARTAICGRAPRRSSRS